MAWLSSVTADNTIVQSVIEYVQRLFWSADGLLQKRTVTRTVTHYVGLTSAAASTQLTASAGTAGCVNAEKQRENDAGAYRVIEELEEYGEWEFEETVPKEEEPA
jgi:hypothetical protein